MIYDSCHTILTHLWLGRPHYTRSCAMLSYERRERPRRSQRIICSRSRQASMRCGLLSARLDYASTEANGKPDLLRHAHLSSAIGRSRKKRHSQIQ